MAPHSIDGHRKSANSLGSNGLTLVPVMIWNDTFWARRDQLAVIPLGIEDFVALSRSRNSAHGVVPVGPPSCSEGVTLGLGGSGLSDTAVLTPAAPVHCNCCGAGLG